MSVFVTNRRVDCKNPSSDDFRKKQCGTAVRCWKMMATRRGHYR
jgi:hypothetical protein